MTSIKEKCQFSLRSNWKLSFGELHRDKLVIALQLQIGPIVFTYWYAVGYLYEAHMDIMKKLSNAV